MSRTVEQTYRERATDQAGSPFRIWISRYYTTRRNHSNGCSAAILIYLMGHKWHCFRTVGMLIRKKSIKLRRSLGYFCNYLPAQVSSAHAFSQPNVCETDPLWADSFEHLKCSCVQTQMQYLIWNYRIKLQQSKSLWEILHVYMGWRYICISIYNSSIKKIYSHC